MQEKNLKRIVCVRCDNTHLELEEHSRKEEEINEGKIACKKCQSAFLIVEGIPIVWPSLDDYLYTRSKLGGELMLGVSSPELKKTLKESLSRISSNSHDNSSLEKRWVRIYNESKKSKFYSYIKEIVSDIGGGNTAVDYGCSIGILSNYMSQFYDQVYGVDQSFYAVRDAKKHSLENTEYLIAHPLNSPFVDKEFDLVAGLNVLDLIEPVELLDLLCRQTKRHLVVSDPYDYDRGMTSVRKPLDEKELRQIIKEKGFDFLKKTQCPQFLPWKININSRLSLRYKVDLVIAKRKSV